MLSQKSLLLLLDTIQRVEMDEGIIRITPHEVHLIKGDKIIELYSRLLFNSQKGEIL